MRRAARRSRRRRSTLGLGQGAHDGQAQARSARGALPRWVGPIEPFEQVRQVLGRRCRVRYRGRPGTTAPSRRSPSSITEPPPGVWRRALSTSAPSIWRSRSRVGTDAAGARPAGPGRGRHRPARLRARNLGHGAQHLGRIDLGQVQRHLPGLGQADRAQVIDDARQQLRLLAGWSRDAGRRARRHRRGWPWSWRR